MSDTAPIDQDALTRLTGFINRIEKLTEEKKAIQEDIKDIFIQAKSAGFDVKVLKHILRERAKTLEERREFANMLQVYLHALGMEAE